ncbi:hypothetical protein HETIRDRAFT_456412 [Heterobasidion irregulare TC 32-1]|uniref:Uncharacterized protein n=1 Tax=Heterobasidion irregulare (strain TC 32-1) TaxID=747525 RepID=W4JPV9_HETIT|nr:uncharacterized protein HETIRDRAFT_456412 [Heterobasidion irregulare TC 32-1]ETW74911.1 hypothetical protein HETIRDRAFT_456412 [Heterobasidion irregulare TC 32-1]
MGAGVLHLYDTLPEGDEAHSTRGRLGPCLRASPALASLPTAPKRTIPSTRTQHTRHGTRHTGRVILSRSCDRDREHGRSAPLCCRRETRPPHHSEHPEERPPLAHAHLPHRNSRCAPFSARTDSTRKRTGRPGVVLLRRATHPRSFIKNFYAHLPAKRRSGTKVHKYR